MLAPSLVGSEIVTKGETKGRLDGIRGDATPTKKAQRLSHSPLMDAREEVVRKLDLEAKGPGFDGLSLRAATPVFLVDFHGVTCIIE
jgi:hypothetical protein